MRRSRSASAISPTGHYTGYAWVHAGLSDDALATTTGGMLFDSLRVPMALAGRLGLPTLDGLLLGRHLVIDDLLSAAIDDGRISQVIEVACGLSPRGLTFSRRYGDRLTYIEADLADMAATKARLLGSIGAVTEHHQVVEIDAFTDNGPNSLPAIASGLDVNRGVAIVTEGLVNYFPTEAVTALWERVAGTVRAFPHGVYLSDIILQNGNENVLTGMAMGALSVFVRGQVHLHFSSPAEAVAALDAAGLAPARLHRVDEHPAAEALRRDPATRLVHVVDAVTG
ncbi:MAG: class I SAM-dependent methyltransferase [Actinomycetota bacterium]|nr:class I SAM-dependent methyltransferase [Actinomycetota bacterium]